MEKLEGIRKRAIAWADVDHHDKAFALQVFMAGDVSAIESGRALDTYAPSRTGTPDLPDYGEINLTLGPMGIQNHGEINSRINVQGLVHVKPVFNWHIDDPVAKQTNDAWVKQSWEEADWGSQFYLAGMEFEAQGLGACEWGPEASGRIVCHHRPYLDTIKDRMYPSPHQWRGVFNRRRIDKDEALEKYGKLYTEAEIDSLLIDYFPIKNADQRRRSESQMKVPVIHEWHYQDPEHECFFLKSIQNKDEKFVVVYDDNLEFKRATGGKAGPNPHGFIPWAWWVDSYLPSNMNPRGKSETVIRIATMLNELENYMVQVVQRGLQIIGVSEKADEKFIKQVEAIKGSKDINKLMIMVGAGNINELLSKLTPDDIPAAVLQLRSILKDELNAATGVMDMQRGQELQRDRVTRYEVSTLKSMQGVQARHMRERYGRFLEHGVQIARALGALWDDRPRFLQLDDGVIDTTFFPIQPHLAMPMVVHADPETMFYLSDDEKRARAVEEFTNIKSKAIELGVADPYRTLFRIYQQVGYKDPIAEGLYTPEEYVMIQQQMALRDAAMAQNGEQNGSQSSSGGSSASRNGQAGQGSQQKAGAR